MVHEGKKCFTFTLIEKKAVRGEFYGIFCMGVKMVHCTVLQMDKNLRKKNFLVNFFILLIFRIQIN